MSDDKFNPYKAFKEFIIIPTPLLTHNELTQSEKICYGALVKFAGRDGKCFPKIKAISEFLNTPERSVKTSIKSLIDKKFITREKKGSTAYHYFFIKHDCLSEVHKTCTTDNNKVHKKCTTEVHKTCTTKVHKNSTSLYKVKDNLKESIKREKKIKKKILSVKPDSFNYSTLPDFINHERFADFIQHRINTEKKNGKFTEQACKGFITLCCDFDKQGYDVDGLINKTVAAGKWPVIYIDKAYLKSEQKKNDPEYQELVRQHGKGGADMITSSRKHNVLNFPE